MNTVRKVNSPLGDLLKAIPGFTVVKSGDFVQATFIERVRKEAYFELGAMGTGIVYGVEFSNAADILKSLKPGEQVNAKVVEQENERGYVELSLAEAGFQKSWEAVKVLKERGEIVTVKVNGANSGGLLMDVEGLKAFMPVSQLAPEHYPRVEDGDRGKILDELKKMIGTELKAKILDFKPRAKKLILSERESVEENTTELLKEYKVGDVVDGIISGVADFGAFMKFAMNPQIEGLIHISEIDHRLIENPKEVVKIGDAVKAKIIDLKDGRVSLSLKALKPDPWAHVEEKYKVGAEITGTVTRFNPFGAFVALDSDIQGLIHVSEFGGVPEMQKAIEVGKSYSFRIEIVKAAEKRIILKLKK